MGTEFIIIGDTDEYKDCLVTLAGRTRETAEKKLAQMLEHPDKYDKAIMGDCYNLRIKEIESEGAWWHDPFLAN